MQKKDIHQKKELLEIFQNSQISKKYFAVWKNAPRNYTYTTTTRTTIKINYYDNEYKNRNFNLPSIIEGEQLTSFSLCFFTALII